MASLVYPSNAATIVELAPLDPNGVKRVDVTLTSWLNGATVSAHTWDTSSGNVIVGDGVGTKSTPNGTLTPAASAESSGVVTAYLYTGPNAVLNRRYTATLSVTASDGKATDRTFSFMIAHR